MKRLVGLLLILLLVTPTLSAVRFWQEGAPSPASSKPVEKKVSEERIEREISVQASVAGVILSYSTAGDVVSAPVVADVDADGELEYIVADSLGYIYLISDRGYLIRNIYLNSPVNYSIAVGNLDFDEQLEIVAYSDEYIAALNPVEGTIEWSVVARPMSTPALADVDSDGRPEVVASAGNELLVVDGDGHVILRHQLPETGTKPAVGDVDSDGRVEVAVATTAGHVEVLEVDETEIWSSDVGAGAKGVVLLDSDGDAGLEVLVFGDGVFLLDDGTVEWTYSTKGSVTTEPAVGDLDGDGKAEVVVADASGMLYVLNAESGTVLWTSQLPSGVRSSPALFDADGDERPDIVIGCDDGYLYAFSSFGNEIFSKDLGAPVGAPVTAYDVDSDGSLEVLAGTDGGSLMVLDIDGAGLIIYWQGEGGGPDYLRTSCIREIDSDLDFLPDAYEGFFGASTSSPDTDGDGHLDGEEVFHSTDPADASSYPVEGFSVKSFTVDFDGSEVVASIELVSESAESYTVEFSLKDSFGDLVYQEAKSVYVSGTATVSFSNSSTFIGNYFARFRVLKGAIEVFDSGWVYAFSSSSLALSQDLGTISQASSAVYSTPFLLNDHESAVFGFQITAPVDYLRATVELGSPADVSLKLGNSTLYVTKRIYAYNSTAEIVAYNIPPGTYKLEITAPLSDVNVTSVLIEAGPALSKRIVWKSLMDRSSVVSKIEGLAGSVKEYSLTVEVYTDAPSDVTLSVLDGQATIVEETASVGVFTESPRATFAFNITFPAEEVTKTLDFKLALGEFYLTRTVDFVSRKPHLNMMIEAKVVKYYQIPGSLNIFETPEMREVAEEELKALRVEDIRIIDAYEDGGVVTNVTVMIKVRNVYSFSFLWMTSYAYYELYFWPVLSADGSWTERFYSIVVYDELETVVIPGVPVKYSDGKPVVELTIKFVKSWWANLLDFVLNAAFKFIPIPFAGLVPKIIMWLVNLICDWWFIGFSVDDLKLILQMVFGVKLDAIMNTFFGTSSVDEAAKSSSPIQIIMTLIDKLDEYKWTLIYHLITWTLGKMKDNPELFASLLEKAIKKVTGQSVEIAASTVKSFASTLLTAIAVVEIIFDAVGKLLAPIMEEKYVSTEASLLEGTFNPISLGDPTLIVEFSGEVARTTLNTSRLAGISYLRISVNRTEGEGAKFSMVAVPDIDSKFLMETLVYDKQSRASLLSMFGITPDYTEVSATSTEVSVEGEGEFLYNYDELLIVVQGGQIRGYAKQRFAALVLENGTWVIDVPVSYVLGKDISYNVSLVLPPSYDMLEVLTPGYVLHGQTLSWTNLPDKISVRLEADSEAPVIEASLPDTCYAKGAVTLDLNVRDYELSEVSVYLDGELLGTWSTGDIDLLLNTTQLPDGAHELVIVAKDKNGNTSEKRITVYVDNTAPEIANLPEEILGGTEAEVILSVYDSFLSNVSVYIDGELYESWEHSGDKILRLNLTGLEEGKHELRVVAVDKAGNKVGDQATLIVDRTPPEIRSVFWKKLDVGLKVEALIAEEVSGLNSVVLYWRVKGESEWRTAGMEPSGGELWTHTIYPPGDAESVEVYIVARDRLGNEARSEVITIQLKPASIAWLLTAIGIMAALGVAMSFKRVRRAIAQRVPFLRRGKKKPVAKRAVSRTGSR